ncbi:hypothetical protein BdWA1_000383 [Babesia duncani]|uniref:Uncharacterized protein n=1 Tax=Babesia duncani TaxID=323732 RepID=A0AAD9PM43_9APIC|nr:hypothetical protein BdWA1_000383 [Babesia duncani]
MRDLSILFLVSFHIITSRIKCVKSIRNNSLPKALEEELSTDTYTNTSSKTKFNDDQGSNYIFDAEYIAKVEEALKRSYGDREVAFFRNMINDFQAGFEKIHNAMELSNTELEQYISTHLGHGYNNEYKRLSNQEVRGMFSISNIHQLDSEQYKTAKALVLLIRHQFEKIEQLQNEHIKPHMQRFIQIRETANQLSPTDVPCATQAGCDRLEMLMNTCTYIRGGTEYAYGTFTIVVHVLGTMMAVLCGCVFVGPAHVCFLKSFPVGLHDFIKLSSSTLVKYHFLFLRDYFRPQAQCGNWSKPLLYSAEYMEIQVSDLYSVETKHFINVESFIVWSCLYACKIAD